MTGESAGATGQPKQSLARAEMCCLFWLRDPDDLACLNWLEMEKLLCWGGQPRGKNPAPQARCFLWPHSALSSIQSVSLEKKERRWGFEDHHPFYNARDKWEQLLHLLWIGLHNLILVSFWWFWVLFSWHSWERVEISIQQSKEKIRIRFDPGWQLYTGPPGPAAPGFTRCPSSYLSSVLTLTSDDNGDGVNSKSSHVCVVEKNINDLVAENTDDSMDEKSADSMDENTEEGIKDDDWLG